MSERLFHHKWVEPNGDITEMHVWEVPKTSAYPEGRVYSFAYISKGKRIIGYDNEHHGTGKSNHHRHIREKILPYIFIDEWQAITDFVNDIEKLRKGAL